MASRHYTLYSQLQDSRLHAGDGVFLHMVRMLQQGEHAPTQGLAAAFFQALLSKDSFYFARGIMPTSAQGLAQPHDALDCRQLLQLVAYCNNLKVSVSVAMHQTILLILTYGCLCGSKEQCQAQKPSDLQGPVCFST